jgi:threonine/homoserine/homoserine lactone efflux protein
MAFETWLAFLAATAVLCVIPGPTIIFLIGNTLAHGRVHSLWSLLGAALGDLVAILTVSLGVGAVLAASATLFTVFKWLGAAYLLWLGVKMWRTRHSDDAEDTISPMQTARNGLVQAFMVCALNPKSIAFFVAFLPQFIDPARSVAPQMAILAATFVGTAMTIAASYVLLADRARRFVRGARGRKVMDRLGGTALIGAGAVVAAMKQS